MTAGISFAGVSVDFDGKLALKEVTVSTDAKSIAVIGSNGSGKSTFARLLNGLETPSSGTVTVFGGKPSTTNAGFLFSNPDLQIVMPTVFEDVSYSLSSTNLSMAEIETAVTEALTQVGIAHLASENCYTLSSGQKQLLAIAGILVRQPKLVIADEPTSLLDLKNSMQVRQLLHGLPIEQLVVVTHDLELAESCEQAIWFEGGELKRIGNPKTLVAAYREQYS